MRFENWMRAAMFIVTLGSGGVLAAGIAQAAPDSKAARTQTSAPQYASGKSEKNIAGNDAVRNKAAAEKVKAVAAGERIPALPLPEEGGALIPPAQQDETPPAENGGQPLTLKGVRG